jgi:hypothetical protein
MRKAIAISIVLGAVSLPGCLWVKPTAAGEKVREETAENVVGCQEVGTAYGKTRTSFGLPRNKDVIREEQVNLARNRAAQIGGDTIVQAGPALADGTLNFTVYRCH